VLRVIAPQRDVGGELILGGHHVLGHGSTLALLHPAGNPREPPPATIPD
jgi:hypothetical protein